MTRRFPLSASQILAWADLFHERTGRWPSVTSGRVIGVKGETWRNVNNAFRYGLRGLPGGSSLALFLAEQRGARNKTSLPPLTIDLILSWAVSHHEQTGNWPTEDSGAVSAAPGENWRAVNSALKGGFRGLPGGTSLGRLLAESHGAHNHTTIEPLTVEQILQWADAHVQRTGMWPRSTSGPVVETPWQTWGAVEQALRLGLRGLPAGSSLYRLLKERRQIAGPSPPVRRLKRAAPGRGRRRIQVEFPPAVLARYRSGELDVSGVARWCRVSIAVARRELQRVGEEIRAPGGRRGAAKPAWHAVVVRRYRRGQSLQAIAQAMGLTAPSVRTILRRRGVDRRPAGPDLAMHGLGRRGRKRWAAQLREKRLAAGLTQAELAVRSGLAQVTISSLENGRVSPTRTTLKKLAKGMRIAMRELMLTRCP